MDWTQIIMAVVALLGGDALLRLLFFRASKKKANAEAVSVEKQNEGTAVETLKSAMEILQSQLDYANGAVAAKEEIIQALTKEKTEMSARLQALFDDMCVHKGCKLRKPHQGQGMKWYEQHADDPSLGCDYLSVEWMLKQWRARNTQTDPEDGNDN